MSAVHSKFKSDAVMHSSGSCFQRSSQSMNTAHLDAKRLLELLWMNYDKVYFLAFIL